MAAKKRKGSKYRAKVTERAEAHAQAQKRAAARRTAKQRPKAKGPKRRATSLHRPDPSVSDDTETRFLQPYQATKTYLCPGCLRDIPPGLGHVVAVPRRDPDLRRHWHRACWVDANR